MKSFTSDIKEASKLEPSLPDKAIFWATQYGDSNCFPEMAAIVARKFAALPNPLAKFGEAVSQAQKRVWIIDQYFLEPEKDKGNRQNRIDQILNWMPEAIFAANDIKLLTKSHNTTGNKDVDNDLASQFREHAEKINKSRSKGAAQCVIEVRFTLMQNFDYVHDRFAIIDDELWHFGATVGGFHSQVSASTRGWRASDHRAEEFFKLAWEARSQMGKKQL
jgi:phosphatidylserine/phosphatidylglycerophosphate/cardiolipin synthase-like enzyme